MRATLRLRSALALGASAALLIGAAPAKKQRAPQPGYQCDMERRGDFGLVKSHVEIFDTGKVEPGHIGWDAGDGTYRDQWFTAAFFRQPDGGYSLGSGYGAVMWHIWNERPGKRVSPLALSLELTANPNPMPVASRIAGKIERSGGPFHLQFDWLDDAALGRGSSKLYLIARNKRREAVRQVAVDGAMFARAEPVLLAVFAEVQHMIADPGRWCTHVDDLGADDIVVT